MNSDAEADARGAGFYRLDINNATADEVTDTEYFEASGYVDAEAQGVRLLTDHGASHGDLWISHDGIRAALAFSIDTDRDEPAERR